MEGDNDDSLVECDIENVVENLNILENEKNGGDDTSVSEVGMTFNDETEMLEFYKRYAFVVGFPVRKRNSKKGEDGVMRYVTFTYSHEGRRSYATNRSLKPQATSQTDYKARISAFLDTLEIWRINKVYIDHSHKTSPSKFRLHRCNQNLSASVKRKLVMKRCGRNSPCTKVITQLLWKLMDMRIRHLSKMIVGTTLSRCNDYALEKEMPPQYMRTFQRCKHGVQDFTSVWT